MLLAEHVVVFVVRGSHFQTACAKFYVDIAVFNHRNNAVDKRHYHLEPFEPCVLGVFGIDAHCGITHNCLGACCRYNSIVTAVGIGVNYAAFGGVDFGRLFGQIIAEIIELRLLFFEEYLVVGDGSAVLRVPVYHAEVAVD